MCAKTYPPTTYQMRRHHPGFIINYTFLWRTQTTKVFIRPGCRIWFTLLSKERSTFIFIEIVPQCGKYSDRELISSDVICDWPDDLYAPPDHVHMWFLWPNQDPIISKGTFEVMVKWVALSGSMNCRLNHRSLGYQTDWPYHSNSDVQVHMSNRGGQRDQESSFKRMPHNRPVQSSGNTFKSHK